MSGVYNRKLFRQSGARDELRKMGGIMSSSEELMREALRTAMRVPGPEARGPMEMQQQPMGMPPPPVMQPQQPMMPMQQPMMQQPMDMGMQQPMMQPQQPMMPMQQPMAAPAFMPPMMPPSVQPQGFKDGGPVSPFPARAAGIATPKLPTVAPVDITKTAGTAVEPPKVSADALATAEKLAGEVDDRDPEEVGPEIVDAATKDGFEPTGDTKADLASIYAQLTGDLSAYEKNIDELNRGIIGAAIAAGTSARATENIAKGMLVGLEGARATEERRAGDARALLLAEAQARAKGTDGDSQYLRDTPIGRTFNDVFSGIMDADLGTLDIPMMLDEESGQMVPAMSQREYATESGNLAVARTFTPQQLVGTQFEGVHERLRQAGLDVSTGGSAAPPAEMNVEAVLNDARQAIKAGRDPAVISDRLKGMGIDPGLL